jgi:hypothetical protein
VHLDLRVAGLLRPGRAVEVVAQHALQSKHERYCFREGIRLEPGDVFVSPLDLYVSVPAVVAAPPHLARRECIARGG